ncbi:MAG: mechanosensitive ion channel family protein [Cyanophyceae cyanobacterium]
MLEKLPFEIDSVAAIVGSLVAVAVGAGLLYLVLFYVLRSVFRRFDRDFALVTLNVSAYPALAVFILLNLKIAFRNLASIEVVEDFERLLTASLIVAVSYWLVQLFNQVVVYYLKEYTQQTEAMWDDVLLPLLEAVSPVVIFLVGGVFVLQAVGVDLTGIWVTLGGATFVIGFAVKDILANFFSGIVLLIDTPFQFGDILRLEDGNVGMLRRIGVRVTQLYMFNSHSDLYIPNSVLQGQNITNLSRPTAYYYYSTSVAVPIQCDLDEVQNLMEEAILGHADTLGSIERKLECVDKFYSASGGDAAQQEAGRPRLTAESEVDFKLEEIELALEALVVTLQFAEKGGLTQEEIENVQQEYQYVLDLVGLEASFQDTGTNFEETQSEEALIELVREWYRAWLRDPNLLDEDQYILPEEWERKIVLLKRRMGRLTQKIFNPQREETRLDDYVMELKKWLNENFKQRRCQWQEPKVWLTEVSTSEGKTSAQFSLNFYIDDMKLEDGKRGDRVSSEIYQEVMRHLKHTYTERENEPLETINHH